MIYSAATVNPSILDKLLDDVPEKKFEVIKSRYQQLNELCNSVRRDLELLLNTRKSGILWHSKYKQLEKSLLNYGIADFMSQSLISENAKVSFCQVLAAQIQTFEPRLKQVCVHLSNENDASDRSIQLRIEGLLQAEPAPEHIVFDSILDPGNSQILITESFID